MEFLHSNFPPVKSKCKSFSNAFYDLLENACQLDIAVGFVTADSLIELKKLLELNANLRLNLIIGMHYPDRFTKVEYKSALELNDYLRTNRRGEVKLVTPFHYHGKLYSYSYKQQEKPFAGIIGSSNLSDITGCGVRTYESSFLVDDTPLAKEINSFIQELGTKAAKNIAGATITSFIEKNDLLDGLEGVRKVDDETMKGLTFTATSFEIPIKGSDEGCSKSNLNPFFGTGRANKKTGVVLPRHWYEVELIVPKCIATAKGYPKAKTEAAIFDVITDDRWCFKCKVSGDYNKNFRSEGNLQILGKWLKGRMENAGALSVGEPVTTETLRKYGRRTFTLKQTTKPNTWFMDFKA